LVDGDGLETGQPARSLAVALRPLQVGVLRCRWFLLGLGMAERGSPPTETSNSACPI
jgi:hypothetical protein